MYKVKIKIKMTIPALESFVSHADLSDYDYTYHNRILTVIRFYSAMPEVVTFIDKFAYNAVISINVTNET